MALLVRLSILGQSWTSRTSETPLSWLEIVNRGRPDGAHPGAVDLRAYEVRRRDGEDIVETVWVEHARSLGAEVLAAKSLRALQRIRPTRSGELAAATWLREQLVAWSTGTAHLDELDEILELGLTAHVEGWNLRRV